MLYQLSYGTSHTNDSNYPYFERNVLSKLLQIPPERFELPTP